MIGFQRDVVLVWWANSDDRQHHGQVMMIDDRQALGNELYGLEGVSEAAEVWDSLGLSQATPSAAIKTAFAYNNKLQQLLARLYRLTSPFERRDGRRCTPSVAFQNVGILGLERSLAYRRT